MNVVKILGRDGEKKEIMDLLFTSHCKDGTKVLPIYGIGKTTMAGLIYLDTQFNHRVRVYVSRDFDLKKIGRSITSQLTCSWQKDSDCFRWHVGGNRKIYNITANLLLAKRF
jgi:hypothetical protein